MILMNIRRLAVLPAAALVASLALTGCGTEAAGAESPAGADEARGPINVLASFYPLQFVAEQVGGDLVEVDNLTPPGADPHFLELSPARTRDVGTADVVVTLSGFIAAVDDAVEQRQPEIVVDAADIVALLPASLTGGHSHGPDGHHHHHHGHSHDHSHDEEHGHSHDHSHDDAEDSHSHDHGHSHSHSHSHDEEHGDHYPTSTDELLEHASDEDRALIEAAAEEHSHDHDHDHGHSHDHDHAEESHDHDHLHDHGHDHGHSHSHDMGGYDPHFWLDPILLSQLAEPVAEALSQVDPENAEVFAANAADLVERLEELDAQFTEALTPFAGATMITNHTAFGYLAHRYGLNQVGITGLDHNIEPSPARMREISEMARHYGVTTLFYETLVSPRVVNALAGDLGINAVVIDTLEGLTPAGIDAGDDYISIMLRNLDTLVEGLTAP